jgi:predicted nucleotidyltransferase
MMDRPAERDSYFARIIEALEASDLIEGIIQLGSGVEGYRDDYSDIDLMVATAGTESLEEAKAFVHRTINELGTLYIKEKPFSENIYLIIAFLENRLEFNVSIVPRELLTVRSPLWKVVADRTGRVTEKMNTEDEKFRARTMKYGTGADLPFEFVYASLSFEKELKRNNLIYALRMLEEMRECTLIIQALNENKKLHQFKAFDTLDAAFIDRYLSTYPKGITLVELDGAAAELRKLFNETLEKNTALSLEPELERLLYPDDAESKETIK